MLHLLMCASAGVAQNEGPQSALFAAKQACSQLNFSLKAGMMRGYGLIDGYSRNSGCGNLCGRATFRWDNGPQGFGDHVKPGTTTQWPSTLNMGASFDPSLALQWGTAMGEEFWGKGTNIQEGPGINVARIMKNGRNFEYVSGEDPRLGGTMAPQIISGIQRNVMAIAKHYVLNNQETHRSGVNEIVDEKTLMELYGEPFGKAAAVAAGFMCAYNRVNGDYACENDHTLQTILKGHYNFSGFVVSDWGATHSTSKALVSGLDIEMPRASFFTQELIERAIQAGNITEARVDDSCVRILSGWMALPEEKRRPCGGGICIDANVSTPEHKALARKVATLTTVLLKNDGGLLPLSHASAGKIALIGPDANDSYTAGGGSGSVVTNAVVSPLAAFSALFADVVYYSGADEQRAVEAAAGADVAIVFGSAHTGEGHDRANLSLSGNIDDLIPKVAARQKKTVVVLSVPGSVLTPWRDSVPAILTNLLPGEQVGPALLDTIFGAVPPQAKLPVTWPNQENEQGMSVEEYPGVPTKLFALQANYSEGLINGYRWYDKHKVAPAFPFGHGLSYATYAYSGLTIKATSQEGSISFDLRRDSGTSGCDTPQVYLSFPTAATDPRVPVKQLRFFQKVCTDSQTLSFRYTAADVSNWDVASRSWKVTPGTYGVLVGSSSQDIRLRGTLAVTV
jgi:beta-glucosidase